MHFGRYLERTDLIQWDCHPFLNPTALKEVLASELVLNDVV